jgi:F0F1-type ATP synthase membrane subunit b/b'
MKDLQIVVNPEGVVGVDYVPEKIQHYPIMNSKLEVLLGEEQTRPFEFTVVVTDPNSISEKEELKRQELFQRVQAEIENTVQSDEEFEAQMNKLGDFFTFSWKDIREQRANYLMRHYEMELDFKNIFSAGFQDALIVGEEIYQCDIVGGEPALFKIDPKDIRVYRSGSSNRIEDADLIIIEKYWSPGRVIDTFYDVLTTKDVEYLENGVKKRGARVDDMDNIDERMSQVVPTPIGDAVTSEEGFFWNPITGDDIHCNLAPFDRNGNVRVLQVYWKSYRKIKKVKHYDPVTGEELYDFYTEQYKINKELGEEEKIYYVNEAWEGTKIGEDIYVNMRPRVVQYNRLSNPSKCHFGIIGQIYTNSDQQPFSLVDKMKPYTYLYDVIHDRLNKLIGANWGTILELDLAKVPSGWSVKKWLHYARVNHIAVVNSFNEGQYGAATGKIAGGLNNNSKGVLNAELGNSIQQYMNILEYIKTELGEVAGINRQREGQVANRETVGGVERANLQSSHITEWYFSTHDNLRKRVYECFLETAKIALKGRSKKFQYLLPTGVDKLVDIEGDEFAESDYGLVCDNGAETQQLQQMLPQLAQAALQNQLIDFSTLVSLYMTASISEKRRLIENSEQRIKQSQQEAAQQEQQAQQQQLQAQAELEQAKMQQADMINQRDNETKILIANINAQTQLLKDIPEDAPDVEEGASEEFKLNLAQKMKEFDEKMKLENKKFEFEKEKHQDDVQLKRAQIRKQSNKSNS